MMCSPATVVRRDRLLCRPTARCWKPIGIPPLAFVVVLVLACGPFCSVRGDSGCGAARDLLASTLGGGDHRWTQVLAASPTSDDSLTLCPVPSGRSTCCTTATERRLRKAAWEHFRLRLRDATTPLSRFLDDTLALFRERLSSLVSEAERSTELLFSDVYAERVAAEARGPVGRLFRALRTRLGLLQVHEEDKEGEDPVDAFFGDLFPLVYFHTVNPRLADFSDEYKRCLRGAQGRLRPFGDAPLRLQGSLSESLGGARTTLRATRLALEVVNASRSPPDDAEPPCGHALARALGCGACTSLPPVMPQGGQSPTRLPCGGACMEAARRSCLWPVEALLEGPWGDLVSALHRLLPRLVGVYSLDEALSLLDSRVSEAVMHAMENGPELAKRVKLECGDPRRRAATTNRTVAELPAAPSGRRPAGATLRGADAALRSRQREFLRQLSASRSLFSSLAGSVCERVSGPPPCWNFRRYEKPVVAAGGGSSQWENPEAKHEASSWDTLLATQARRLREMTTEVLSHRVALMPDSDSYTLEGSGSGAPSGPWDDEEFAEGSGSGDDKEEAAPVPTAHSLPASTPAPPPKTAGSSKAASAATAALVVALLCCYLWS